MQTTALAQPQINFSVQLTDFQNTSIADPEVPTPYCYRESSTAPSSPEKLAHGPQLKRHHCYNDLSVLFR
jgi:hypothetical protein